MLSITEIQAVESGYGRHYKELTREQARTARQWYGVIANVLKAFTTDRFSLQVLWRSNCLQVCIDLQQDVDMPHVSWRSWETTHSIGAELGPTDIPITGTIASSWSVQSPSGCPATSSKALSPYPEPPTSLGRYSSVVRSQLSGTKLYCTLDALIRNPGGSAMQYSRSPSILYYWHCQYGRSSSFRWKRSNELA